MTQVSRIESTRGRHRRVRRKVVGTTEQPRLAIFRSNQHVYAQVIDDARQVTLVAASTLEPELRSKLSSGATCSASAQVGQLVAQRSLEKGIQHVVFDRGGKLYHGRVKALADAAREAGLQF